MKIKNYDKKTTTHTLAVSWLALDQEEETRDKENSYVFSFDLSKYLYILSLLLLSLFFHCISCFIYSFTLKMKADAKAVST